MKESIELRGRDIKISYLLTLMFIISIFLAVIGFWTGAYRIIGLNSPPVAITVLFIIAFILCSLIVLFISMWPKSIDIEFSQVDEVKQAKHEKVIPEEGETHKPKDSLKLDIEGKREDTFEVREAEFLESPAYQYLFDYVKRMIDENDIHVYWQKLDLEELLVDFNQNEMGTGNKSFMEGELKNSYLSKLRLYLAKKRFYFSENEFKSLIENELFRQTYEDLKKYILFRNPQNLDDFIIFFLEFVRDHEYEDADIREVIQKFIDRELDVTYLKEILQEQKIEYRDQDLHEEIRRVGEGLIF